MAMGLQLESLSQSSFEQYGPWHFHDIRFKQDEPVDLGAALRQVSSIPGLNDRLSELSKSGKGQLQSTFWAASPMPVIAPPKSMSTSATSLDLDLSTQASCSTVLTPCPSKPPLSRFGGADSSPIKKIIVTFPIKEQSPKPKPSLKRRRPDTDVDGPNTASLGCKKRRLLRHLITSRLSEPFSLPATHILNRESVASGDRRFLKLATILAARRMNHPGATLSPQPSPSSILRRTAVFNRIRIRQQMNSGGQGGGETRETGSLAGSSPLPQGHTTPSAFGSHTPSLTAPTCLLGPHIPSPRDHQGQPHILSRSGIIIRSSPPGSPAGLRPTEGGGLLRLPSPRLRPLRSPELRTSRPAIELAELDDLDDENTAFPSSEHESRYDDDPDDVYADFGLIFGGGEGDLSDEEGSTDHFEDVMDDLDGIPWTARC